jgi:surfeit locus 1 family protein
VLVNRGFVPVEHRQDYLRPPGEIAVTGLLRMSEPGGRFLRPNRPEADLWYSRDVAAIAAERGLGEVAPFFLDAEQRGQGTYPIGGLTVLRFRTAHLAYALTWLTLAGMAAFGAWRVYQDPRRNRR